MIKIKSIFAKAMDAINDRVKIHGDFRKQSTTAAEFWTTYVRGKAEITPHDVAIMNVLQKISRIKDGSHAEDHYVDMAGYTLLAHQSRENGNDVVYEEPEDGQHNL